jgi:hypothetical protein
MGASGRDHIRAALGNSGCRWNPNADRIEAESTCTDARGGLQQRGIEIELPLPGEERYQIYHVNGDHGVLDSGSRSEWITAKP